MSEGIAADRPITLAPGFRFQWEEAQSTHVLLYPEGMVKLSESASAILSRCDGARTLNDIVSSLEEAFPGAELRADVVEFLEIAVDRGWLRLT